MKLPSFLFILYFISIIKGASIKNLIVHSATAGIITYENLKSKIYATSLHQDFRKHILQNFENERYENSRFDADGRNRRITGSYLKRIFLPDRWHELFYFYSFTTIIEKSFKKKQCRRINRMLRCNYIDVPQHLDGRDVQNFRTESINRIQRQIKVEFSPSVDENNKEQFYAQYPNLRN